MTLSRRKTLALDRRRCDRRRRGRRRLRDHPPSGQRLLPWEGGAIRRSAHARAELGDPRAEFAQPAAVEGGPVGAGSGRALPRSRPPASRNGPVQSPDHRIAGLFSGASAHGGPSGRAGRRGRPVPRWRGSGRPRRTPRRDLPLRPRDRCARSALRRCRHAAQQQGTLRHVATGPGRGAGPDRLGRAVIPMSGSPVARRRSRSFAP
jgi:hypothetical protein